MQNTSEFEPVLPRNFLMTRPLVDVFLDPVRQMNDRKAWMREVMLQSNVVSRELQEYLELDGWDNTVRNVHLSLLDTGVFIPLSGQVPRSQIQISEVLLTVGYQMYDESLRKEFFNLFPLQDRIMGQLWGTRELPRSAYEKTLPTRPGRAAIMDSIYEGMLLVRRKDEQPKPLSTQDIPAAFLEAFDS